MTYYSGFVAAVPKANRDVYIKHVTDAWPSFQKLGAVRMVENWAEDVQPGQKTDFIKAVAAKDDEAVVFSWVEWPDRATADAAWERMQNDQDISASMGEMPFDGKRMIFGGFSPVISQGTDRGAGYYQGFLTPIPAANRAAFEKMGNEAWEEMFKPGGAIGSIESWGEDVPHGKLTDMYRAVDAQEGEVVVLSWTAWPDRATCDAAAKAMEASMADSPPPADMPFDMSRMIYGGFAPIFDSAKA